MRLHLWPHLPPLRHQCEGCCNFRVVSTFSHSVAVARCCDRRASLAQRLARKLIRSRRARLAAPFVVFAACAARCVPAWWARARSLHCCSSVAISLWLGCCATVSDARFSCVGAAGRSVMRRITAGASAVDRRRECAVPSAVCALWHTRCDLPRWVAGAEPCRGRPLCGIRASVASAARPIGVRSAGSSVGAATMRLGGALAASTSGALPAASLAASLASSRGRLRYDHLGEDISAGSGQSGVCAPGSPELIRGGPGSCSSGGRVSFE
jgi:hypothetical protein